ncbi:bifunctional UDP-N-acetylglucosamine diphosphorylase/glucosamine-1-phosphate N-acetyltransferase GlmU [Nicoliella spurrieriana]|uniref:Bifunctional protein GlmU n=1 Tax=Nicoliella spurrieriana TaxID=2925830 RepID=A0A976RSN1_9LACO|nr:bifunctional UDP-N-acetylglucosamine diphosphorylase/glucosamine-1-phosphate N-acetyltransferase GlmU [Nicoliella spurrieriana]UQS87068.1 bifunctional UDP-N-acetylglucosamine diphosphorylase/glucosamine-1-phosphate N-acetyltransferase GlmU [Nicoliella spurrieriana]
MAVRNTIILAAGKGTRMKSKLYKVLHRICGRTMVDHVLTQVEKTHMDNVVTVVGYGAEDVEHELGDRTKYVVQEKQLGTGDAVIKAEPLLAGLDGTTMVVSGDTPLFTSETFEKLFKYHEEKQAAVTILTSKAPNPTGYGRIVRNDLGIVEKIVEQKDASKEEQAINEINTGVYVFDNQALFDSLHKINNNNAQGEYYLTDVIEILRAAGRIIAAYQMDDFNESMGVNDRIALSRATKVMQARINHHHMAEGVSIINPEDTYIDVDIQIGSDTVIEPGVQIHGQTTIGSDCKIGANSEIIDCKLHDHITVTSSYLQESEMLDYSDIGPYSHLRPNALIGEHVHLGNFVEVKKAQIDEGTKVGHLTYIGNAHLGRNINVGCGVIFANYDGKNKHNITVGDASFIGSNSNLIAPINIADHSFIAAGSTITDDVNEYDMAIARARQTNKPGYYQKLPYDG